jgi:hypothetical protein
MRRNVTDVDRQDIDALIPAGSGGGPAAPTIHLILQGKGGDRKSLVSSILAQYFRHRGADIHCLDTDPVNQTFSQYAELAAEHRESMRDGKIDPRGFDVLMEPLLTDEGIFIVENNVLELLRATGRRLCVHTVVTGRQALGDTLKGFNSLADHTADRNIVVWLNEYFGLIERDGKTFTEMLAYKESDSKIFGMVRIPKRNQDTFGRDIEEVIARKLTFEDAIRNGSASVMSKLRFKVGAAGSLRAVGPNAAAVRGETLCGTQRD